jgi:outer membrane assembly lipoprotein YfiO
MTVLLAYGCGHGGEVDIATLSSSSDQILWEAGEKAVKKKNWESARKIFKRIIDGFPQSEYGPGARLALGDSYINEGGLANSILAVSAYRDFLTLYPSHPKSDYAQFQLAECHYKQKNNSDRDQTETEKALVEYQKLLEFYPSSPHIDVARTRITDCRQGLARAEFTAGELGPVEYKRIEDRAVDAAIALQVECGLDAVTDGEMRRFAFYGHLIDCVEGFDKLGGWAIAFRDEAGNETRLERPVVVSRLRRRRHLCAEEFAYLDCLSEGRSPSADTFSLVRFVREPPAALRKASSLSSAAWVCAAASPWPATVPSARMALAPLR